MLHYRQLHFVHSSQGQSGIPVSTNAESHKGAGVKIPNSYPTRAHLRFHSPQTLHEGF